MPRGNNNKAFCCMADPFDKTSLMERLDGDCEFLAEMLAVYGKDRIRLISEMRTALSRRDAGALADAAHALAGLALNLFAEPAAHAARSLETLAEKGDFVGAGDALVSLEEETHRLELALRDVLRQERGSDTGSRRAGANVPSADRPTRVITVDDQELVRSGIRLMLRAFDDIELVGEASSGAQSLRLCEELRPDVVLMDVRMPNMDGVTATRTIRRQYPDTQVLVLSVYHSSDLVTEAMQAGAIGYVMKNASREELVKAVRAANQGRTTLSPEAASDLVASSGSPSTVIGDDLSDRERQVLSMLAKGMRNSQIAKEINKSPYTVRHYVSEVIAKLGAKNRAEAAAIAVKHGLAD